MTQQEFEEKLAALIDEAKPDVEVDDLISALEVAKMTLEEEG